MAEVYLLLGGNLGDKQTIFSQTRTLLAEETGEIQVKSAVYETEPWGFQSDDVFWNQVIKLNTRFSPEEILTKTQQIEQKLGRIRKENQYDSRIIDIDILFYGDEIMQEEKLIVPHPRIQERKFALVPLNEIAPDLIHPVFQKSIQKLLDECTDQLKVKIVPEVRI
ncbi:MAG: 2-amino-4-hydroxy-6-hydroxymethyldihydropteridine diphosphokinase [Prolixibacteraceae bacterium]|jgi:2-amino-4-hydroxy-6-hydroxymethyldihydropteridine diphosphokinase